MILTPRKRRRPMRVFILLAMMAGLLVLTLDLVRPPQPPITPTVIAVIPTATPNTITTPSGPRPTPTLIPTTDPRSFLAVVPTSEADVTTLFIPSAGVFGNVIDVYLTQNNWNLSYLGNNIGHLQGTSRFNQGGNVVLAGHVETTEGGRSVFANLPDLPVGEMIFVSRGGVEWRYRVIENRVVSPTDTSVLHPTLDDRLTLITCGAYNLFQDTYEERIVVIAVRVS